MLDLVKCEFWKLKRKKFIFLTILAAALFPIPMTAFAAKSNLGFDWLYLNIGVFGYFLLLPTVLGILGAILKRMEHKRILTQFQFQQPPCLLQK